MTDYIYNVDGALTAVTARIDGGQPDTHYLTWDNFVPDALDATSGQVLADDGRLVGIGSTPGRANAAERFSFDLRDRLLSYSGPAGSETFDYHGNGDMSVAATDADALNFYYDQSINARVTNIHQVSADAWSAYLGHVRFLSDGTEQVQFQPRKDVACSYDTSSDALQSYVYDAYGTSPLTPPGDTYDLTEPPFRYGGEYRDPIWGGYYLRARWYHPDLTVFLSRDSMRNLSRYGYTSGNPVMRVDPSGFRFKYMREIGNPTGSLLKKLNRGVIGHVWRTLFAPLAGPMQIIAAPGAFWHAVKTNQSNIDVFLVLGVGAEVAGGFVDSALAGVGTSYLRRIVTRSVADAGIGLGQTVSAAANHGFDHFDWNTFAQGVEYTASAIGYRGLTGFNVRQARAPRAGMVRLANDLDRSPAETSLLSGSRSSSVRRGSFDVGPPTARPNELSLVHDDLLADLEPENVQRSAFDQGLRDQERDIKWARKQVKSLRKMEAKARTKQSVEALRSQSRMSAAHVSRAPRLGAISEDTEAAQPFPNQAQIHAGYVVDALEEE